MKQYIFLAFALSVLATACKKDDNNNEKPQTKKVVLGKKTIGQNQTVTLWADDSLTNAYTILYLSVQNAAGGAMPDAQVSILPVMNMGNMEHSAPYRQPKFDSRSQLFEGAVIFTMPGQEGWRLDANVNGEKISFPLRVNPSKEKTVTGFTGKDGKGYVISLVRTPFQVGLNDFIVTLHRRESMMQYEPVNDAFLEFRPEMPSMGHGSPNNVSPVFDKEGMYKGKVNFTMTGDWRFYFNIKRQDAVVAEDISLEILF